MVSSKVVFTVLENMQSSIQVAKKNEKMTPEKEVRVEGSSCTFCARNPKFEQSKNQKFRKSKIDELKIAKLRKRELEI